MTTDESTSRGRTSGGSRPDQFQPEEATPSVDVATRRQFLRVVGTGAALTAGTGLATAQETPVVTMGSNYFDPIGLYVEPGTTVRFELESGSHSATAYEGRVPSTSTPFDSGVITSGSFSHRFDTPGTYDYYCIPHESGGMVGRIVVGEPGGPAHGSAIPAGTVPDSDEIVDRGAIPIDEFDGGSSPGGSMRGSGSGMMDGSPGGMMLIPLGFMTAFFGLVAGVIYWATGRTSTNGTVDSSPRSLLNKRYARGEIDDEEFQRRLEQLDQTDET